jgi:hypothetical protein
MVSPPYSRGKTLPLTPYILTDKAGHGTYLTLAPTFPVLVFSNIQPPQPMLLATPYHKIPVRILGDKMGQPQAAPPLQDSCEPVPPPFIHTLPMIAFCLTASHSLFCL